MQAAKPTPLVTASPPRAEARLTGFVMKRVTGGEPLVVRDLNTEPLEYRFQFECLISCYPKGARP